MNARQGKRLALSRLITLVENRARTLPAVVKEIHGHTGRAHVIGITGPPGAGKSTLVDRLMDEYRKAGKRVAVVAVDPSSPFSGGAILGDRIRMQRHFSDDGVFIRSLATRGKHGGLSIATKEVVMVLDAVGYDIVLVETAGVGQTELDILQLAHTVLVVLVPESGDSIQVMKAGLMEIADVFAVNKSDRPEADLMVRELTNLISILPHDEHSWIIPIQKTEGVHGRGIAELQGALERHKQYLEKSGAIESKRRRFIVTELREILAESLQREFDAYSGSQEAGTVIDSVMNLKLDPYTAALRISQALNKNANAPDGSSVVRSKK